MFLKFILPGYLGRSLDVSRMIAMDYGHDKSVVFKRPLDAKGKYIPWYTYPAIEFLETLDLSKKNVFEWGSGYSTFYWSERVKSVKSIENNESWLNTVKSKTKTKNSRIIFCKTKKDYIKRPLLNNKKYDVVVIDGDFRPDCAKVAPKIIKKGGIIIFDNSDWFPKTVKYLDKYFFRVDFSGIGPSNSYSWTTSIYFNFNNVRKKIDSLVRKTPHPIGGIKQELD